MQNVNQSTKRLIGIDGGGSKTSCVLGDENGRILSIASGPSSNIHSVGIEKACSTLKKLIDQVIENTQIKFEQVGSIYLCLAGADREKDKITIKGFFEQSIYSKKIIIQNDAQAALAAGTWGESGILLIAGTGSIVFRNNGTLSESIRVGGWGYLFGDEGSGFYIGRRALNAIFKAYDNRGSQTMLTEFVLNHFEMEEVPELVSLYSTDRTVPRIAELSKYVFDAARKGDSIAKEIMMDAIDELALMIAAVSKESEGSNNCSLVLHGGLFTDPLFLELFKGKLNSVLGNFKFINPEIPAVVGAYILALKETGFIIDEKVKETILISWNGLTSIVE